MKRWLPLFAFALSACGHAQESAPHYPAPIQALQAKGIRIKSPMQAPHGFKAYMGDYAGHRVPIYLLPDGEHVAIGELFDGAGNDLTEDALQKAAQAPLDAAVWNKLADATWIAEGADKPARVVYVFTDTECPFCHRLWKAVQPLLADGTVQVRYVMVAVIAPQSEARAARILDSADPLAAMEQHETDFRHSPITPQKPVPAATAQKIRANTALMRELGFQGTPATVYKDADGRIRSAVGMLPATRIQRIFGSAGSGHDSAH